MHPNPPRILALLSLSLCIFSPAASSQKPAATLAPGSATGQTSPAGQTNDDTGGLPTFLLPVPAGQVFIGLDVDAFVAASAQAAFVYRPEDAHKVATEKFRTAMRRSASVLGRQQVHVDGFLLGKTPVTNAQWKVYVDAQRAAGKDVRPPFHWWREGCKDDYEKRLPDIRKEFPKIENAPLFYWERHGHELPYKLVDKDGKSIADLPVVYISWRDANAFAASVGMRLPTERELTRAMRGDGSHTWPWGAKHEDKYTKDALKWLRMAKTSDLRAKPVGTVAEAAGPFGHADLFGQVWQLVGDLGYEPINGIDIFLDQWKLLMKHKTGRLIGKKPTFSASRAIAKGGSFLSYQEPIQLLIDARAPILTTDVLEALGLRLAKSMKPGYDFLYSLQRVKFNRGALTRDQKLDLDKLVGGEHYTLADNGFPTAYDAVAFAPTNWLTDDKRMRWKKLSEMTQDQPILIGALATTAKLADGTDAGLHAVYYRAAGISKDLRTAIKAGHKAVKAARKAAAKAAKNGKEPKKSAEQRKPSKWRELTQRAGLTEDDLAEAKASTGDVGFIRIDGVTIPTDRDAYVLARNGSMVGVIPGTNKKPTTGDDKVTPTLELTAGEKQLDGKTIAHLRFAIPLTAHNARKTIIFDLQAVLDQKLEGNWRK